jgi:uncharacterized membrane protein YphA (DoxX/SURF4 family)
MSTSKSKIASHIIAGILTLMFLMAGGTKLMAMDPHPASFEGWGLPIWFMYVTGLTEVVAAGLTALPKTRLWGALLVGATMLGAIATHLMNAEFAANAVPLVLGGLAGTVAWLEVK